MNPIEQDYLVLEDLLVTRIKESIPELKAVLTAMDLSTVQEQRQLEPAVHVMYAGDEVGSGSGMQGSTGGAQVAAQIWMVVLVVKFAGADSVRTGKGQRQKAGRLIARLLQCLCGWQPAVPMTALRRTNSPKVAYQNGFAYFPFNFKTQHVLLGKI
ncbi:hypothetical protein BH11PSE12_BH11PSE12_08320 [soil metagenome]